jgi:hypothetical protein
MPEEWLRMPVWGQREVVNREIRIMCPIHMPHLRTLRALTVAPHGYIHSQPQLAIEVSHSESRTKTALKLSDYGSIGTEQVWFASPEAATVEGLYLERGRLGRNTIFAEGVLRSKHLLSVPIDTAQTWPD